MIRSLDAATAKALVHAGGEIAFLDVREAGQFGEGHPLFAVPCPYSRLEAMVLRLAPRRSVTMLLIDAGDGVAERAARHLERLGYQDVAVVAGGAPGWLRAGLGLFKGVNVPSKTLGELAEHEWRPETIDAARLKEWRKAGAASLFDARPPEEFLKMHVPGAVCLPNGELAHRLAALPDSGGRAIVVGCAGRTRGIVGAIGLKLIGDDGPIYALENGTQGWALAGEPLERGVAAAPFPPLDTAAEAAGRQRAERFLRQWDIPVATAAGVAELMRDRSRTSFVFDVRSLAEARADPVAIAVHAPGGQLVQASDQYVGVRHARLILCDDLGVRAGLAAFWLRQLGYEPVVALIDDALRDLPPAAVEADHGLGEWPWCEADAALEQADLGGARFVDIRASQDYRRGHVPGALWSTRARLASDLAGDGRRILLIADDEAMLAGAVRELRDAGRPDLAAVRGGHAALVRAGAEEIATPSVPDDEDAIDFLRFVHDRHDGNLDASRRYLAWETGLVSQLDADERAAFRLAGPARTG